MKPEPLEFTSFASRIGSPATKGARTIMPLRFSIAFGRSVLRIKLPLAVVAGQACQKTSAGVQRLTSRNIGFRHQNIDGVEFGNLGFGSGAFSDPPASRAAMPPAATATVSQHHDTCSFRTPPLTRQSGRSAA